MNNSNYEYGTLKKKHYPIPMCIQSTCVCLTNLQVMSFNSCKERQCNENNLGTIFWIEKGRIRDKSGYDHLERMIFLLAMFSVVCHSKWMLRSFIVILYEIEKNITKGECIISYLYIYPRNAIISGLK